MKSTNNFLTVKFAIVVVCLFIVNMIFGQGAHPGVDPGMPVPVDGGILMALLAGGGLMAMLLKKKRKDE